MTILISVQGMFLLPLKKMIFNLEKEDHVVIKKRLDRKIARGKPNSERTYKYDHNPHHKRGPLGICGEYERW